MSSTKDMFKLVRDFYSSGKTHKAFCEQAGIRSSTFSYWIKKYKLEKEPAKGFVKIDTSQVSAPNKELEITYPNGVKVKADSSDFSILSKLINLYQHV